MKGRAALLNLGLERPDLIDSGVLDWDAQRYGDDKGRLKEKMSFGEQVRPGMVILDILKARNQHPLSHVIMQLGCVFSFAPSGCMCGWSSDRHQDLHSSHWVNTCAHRCTQQPVEISQRWENGLC